jgi:hypothetical protein
VVSTLAFPNFTETSGRAAERDHALDVVYEFLCFGETLPRKIYYQLVKSEFLHPKGELRQPGRYPGRTVQAHDGAEGLLESPPFLAKVIEYLEQVGELGSIELLSLEGELAVTAQGGAP